MKAHGGAESGAGEAAELAAIAGALEGDNTRYAAGTKNFDTDHFSLSTDLDVSYFL